MTAEVSGYVRATDDTPAATQRFTGPRTTVLTAVGRWQKSNGFRAIQFDSISER